MHTVFECLSDRARKMSSALSSNREMYVPRISGPSKDLGMNDSEAEGGTILGKISQTTDACRHDIPHDVAWNCLLGLA